MKKGLLVEGTRRNLLGYPFEFSHHPQPEIAMCPAEILNTYVRSSSDIEIAVFVKTLRLRDTAAQRRAVEAIIKRSMDHSWTEAET